MSVFTPVTDADLADWLKNYAIGRLDALQGISAGVQNSNFFVTTSLGRYVLTLFETMPRAELPFYLHLMAHLARHGLPVPAPIANRDNEYLGTLSGKPAVLVSRLAGRSEMASAGGTSAAASAPPACSALNCRPYCQTGRRDATGADTGPGGSEPSPMRRNSSASFSAAGNSTAWFGSVSPEPPK